MLYVVGCMLCVVRKVRGIMKNKYDLYKLSYENYLLLFKCGNFYLALNKDAIVMNNILNYKIKDSKSFFKVGFPLTSLDKVLKILEEKQINYLVIDNEITFKKKNKINNYEIYLNDKHNYESILTRINKIDSILKNNVLNSKIELVLDNIERDLCKISC